MAELPLILLIFALGSVVTVATIVLVLRGHAYWKDRDPYDGDALH